MVASIPRKSRTASRVLLGTLLLGIAALAPAADLPKEGTYDYSTCFQRNILQVDYSPQHMIWSYDQRGTAVSNPPGGMFDGDDIQCVGMSALFDGKRFGSAACITTGKDGSKRLTKNWYDAHGKMQAESVMGSGLYEGLVTAGTVTMLKDPGHQVSGKRATVELCNRSQGTYKLK